MALVSGCMTIFNAHEEQKALAAKGYARANDVEKVCLQDYSLQELVQFAMTNRPSVVAAALAVADAHLALREIAADAPLISYSPWTAPHFSLNGGYNASSDGDSSLHWNTEGSASAGISMDILLYDFGRNQAQASAQVEKVIAAEMALVEEGYSVFREVSVAYFTLMAKDALLEVARTNETEYAIHLEEAESRLAAGEAQRLDVTRARLDLSQAKEKTIAVSNLVVTSGAELMKALGIDVSRGTRDVVFPSSGTSLSTVMRAFTTTGYDINAAYAGACTNAPALAIARAKLRAASRDVDYAVANLMPSINAEIGINWADPLWAWHWGVNGVQSIFEGFRKVTAVDRAVVAMHSAASDVDEAEQQLSLNLQVAIADRDNAAEAHATAQVSVESARENLAVVKAQYHAGEASRVDFTDAVSSYATSLGSRVTAFYDGQIAEAKLFAIVGTIPQYREEIVNEK